MSCKVQKLKKGHQSCSPPEHCKLLSFHVFFPPISELTVAEPAPSSMATTVGKSCPPLQARCGSVSRLMVTPRVSGLERSQEKSLEQHFPETVCPSTSSASFSRLPSPGAAAGPLTRPNPNGNSSRHNGSPPLSKPKPFPPLPGRPHSIYINNRYYKCFSFLTIFILVILTFCFYCFGSVFILSSLVFSGATPQSSLPRLLQQLQRPHLPCARRPPPPGSRHAQAPCDLHPGPALGLCSHPHRAFLLLHLCSKAPTTPLPQVL